MYVKQELQFEVKEDENKPCVALPYANNYKQASINLQINQLLESDTEFNASAD